MKFELKDITIYEYDGEYDAGVINHKTNEVYGVKSGRVLWLGVVTDFFQDKDDLARFAYNVFPSKIVKGLDDEGCYYYYSKAEFDERDVMKMLNYYVKNYTSGEEKDKKQSKIDKFFKKKR